MPYANLVLMKEQG